MGAGAVQDHATYGAEEHSQGAHSDDGDEYGVQRLQHVPRSVDLVVFDDLGEICDVHD